MIKFINFQPFFLLLNFPFKECLFMVNKSSSSLERQDLALEGKLLIQEPFFKVNKYFCTCSIKFIERA